MVLFVSGAYLLHFFTFVVASTPVNIHPAIQTCAALLFHDICVNEQHTLAGDYTLPDGAVVGHTSWRPVGPCHYYKGNDFCAFSNPSFNRGDGISIITTRDSITKVSSRPVFRDVSTTLGGQEQLETARPYKVAAIPGKGLGLIATEMIRSEHLVMSRTPAVVVNANAVHGLDKDHLASLLKNGIESLSAVHRNQYLDLSTHDSAGTYEEKIYKIFKTNSFRTGAHDGESDFHSTFTEGWSILCSNLCWRRALKPVQ